MEKKYKMSEEKSMKIIAGGKPVENNWWNNSIGFGIVGSTIISAVQLVFSIVNVFTNKNNNTTSNYNPSYIKQNLRYKISKYPSKSSVFM